MGALLLAAKGCDMTRRKPVVINLGPCTVCGRIGEKVDGEWRCDNHRDDE